MKAVSVSRYGGPEVLEIVDVDTPSPGAGQVLVDVAFAGVNFMDIYARSGVGQYAETPPFVLGGEGSGRVLAVGDGVSGFAPGQRVVWKAARGSYAELVAAPAAELVPVPDAVSDEAAAAVFLQGLTAHYLVHSTHPIQTGEVVVVHAAAGGVGLLLTQMATLRGARPWSTTHATAPSSSIGRCRCSTWWPTAGCASTSAAATHWPTRNRLTATSSRDVPWGSCCSYPDGASP